MYVFYLLIFLMPFPEYRRFSLVIGDMTLIKLVGILAVVMAIFRHLSTREKIFCANRNYTFFIIIFYSMLFCLHFSTATFAIWSVHLALLYIVMVFVDSIKIIINVFWITIFGLLINCYQSWKGIFKYGWYDRAAGSFGDANYFALALIVAISFCFAIFCLRNNSKWLISSIMLMLFSTLLLTQSRGGLLGLSIMMLLLLKISKHRFKIVFIVGCICIPLAIYFTPKTIERIKNKDVSTITSTKNRIKTQVAGLKMIKDNMWNGVGIGNYKASAKLYNPEIADDEKVYIAHNSYISVGAEMGVPVLIAFVLVLLSTWRTSANIAKNAVAYENRVIATALNICLTGYLCSILFLTAEREKYLWLLLYLIMALDKITFKKQTINVTTDTQNAYLSPN